MLTARISKTTRWRSCPLMRMANFPPFQRALVSRFCGNIGMNQAQSVSLSSHVSRTDSECPMACHTQPDPEGILGKVKSGFGAARTTWSPAAKPKQDHLPPRKTSKGCPCMLASLPQLLSPVAHTAVLTDAPEHHVAGHSSGGPQSC